MQSRILPLCCVLLIFLISSDAYNKTQKLLEKCDDKPCETGPCKAMFPMWRFIKETRQCESFIYGGCKGTKNLFQDEKECKAQCLS